MWYPRKAAFRAGFANGIEWDDASIGAYSAATGSGTANGEYSTAIGAGTIASGQYSTAMGAYTTASGSSSTAIGLYSTASGHQSTALGTQTVASGFFSTALGWGTVASSDYTVAMGKSGMANHPGSIVLSAHSGLSSDSVRTGGNEQIVLRAYGGAFITNASGQAPYDVSKLINTSTGAYLSSGGAWTNASSRDFKENIADLSLDQAFGALAGLHPVTYAYKADKDEKHVGFIAEDVPDLVSTKDRKGLSPMDIVAVLTKVVQNQQVVIEESRKEISYNREQIELLKRRIESLESGDR
jgi:hypothetical protein